MANLLRETLLELEENGLTKEDVLWVGCTDIGYTTWEEFEKKADIEYDAGYGAPEINYNLLVVGKDWWLERGEYDGSEWWDFKTMPKKPEKKLDKLTVIEDLFSFDEEDDDN